MYYGLNYQAVRV